MKKFTVRLLILALMLTACASRNTEEPLLSNGDSYPNPSYPNPSYPNPSYLNDDTSTDITSAQIAALAHLSSTLNLSADQIALVSSEAVPWPDGCLGVQRLHVMCTQALVEGFRFVLEADGREYELHTNATGSAVVIASGLDINPLLEAVLIREPRDFAGSTPAPVCDTMLQERSASKDDK